MHCNVQFLINPLSRAHGNIITTINIIIRQASIYCRDTTCYLLYYHYAPTTSSSNAKYCQYNHHATTKNPCWDICLGLLDRLPQHKIIQISLYDQYKPRNISQKIKLMNNNEKLTNLQKFYLERHAVVRCRFYP